MAGDEEDNGDEIVVRGKKKNSNFFKTRLLKFVMVGGLDINGKQYYFSNGRYTIEVEGIRSTVLFSYFGGAMLGKADIAIYNLPHTLADEISLLGQFIYSPGRLCNQIIVYATTDFSDEFNPRYVKVFEGSIIVSYTDYNVAPDYVTHIQAQTAGGLNNVPCPYVSFDGQVDSENIVKAIVNNFKLTINSNKFQTQNVEAIKGSNDDYSMVQIRAKNPIISHVININVKTSQNNPHYIGDLITQLNECAKAGSFEYNIQNSVLYMYQRGEKFKKEQEYNTPLFSPAFGMIGYPQYSNNGILVESVFQPFLIFGQPVQIYSKVKPACGIWCSMISMEHRLSSLMPNGDWYTKILVSNQVNKSATANE